MTDETDKIMETDAPDLMKAFYLAKLCRHRGECMDADAKLLSLQRRLIKNNEAIIKNLEDQARIERPLFGRLMVAINNWAKS